MGWLAYLTLAFLLMHHCQGDAQSYPDIYGQYDHPNYNYDQDGEPPTFQARPQTFTVEMGQSVIIPCDEENTGENKLIIKRLPAGGGADKLLAVGSDKVIMDRHITVEGSRLTILRARPKDAGTYICQFDTEPPIILKHTLHVQYAPTIKLLSQPQQVVRKGEEVTLACVAHGNPNPSIRWSRQEGVLPSGKTTELGANLTVPSVDRHSDGTYLCTADNGIGEPASQRMVLTVEYPPEVEPMKSEVRGAEGDTLGLGCVVHGRPVPEVGWTHNGAALEDTHTDASPMEDQHDHHHDPYDPHIATSTATQYHTLTLHNITDDHFGNYTCIAHNAHGRTNATIVLTGLPTVPEFSSSPSGEERYRYKLTWTTESLAPITQFVLKYRKHHAQPWPTNITNGVVVAQGADWKIVSREVDSPAVVQESPGRRYSLKFTLAELEVATDYEVVVQVMNKYGWSSASEPFVFSTKKGNEAMAVLQSTSGTIALRSSFCLFALVLAVASATLL